MSTKRKADGHLKAFSRPSTMKSRAFQTDAERDSGFSDASSEHMSTMDTTDSEYSPCPVVQQGAQTPTQGSQSQSPKSGQQTPQLTVMGGSYSGLSPMIIMNNVLLKQPGDNPPALKPWGLEVVQPVVQQPQVVFIQPVVSRQTSKDSSSRHRRSKKYLPILKSYPKIAPHPGDSSSSSGRGTSSSSSSSSSSLSGSERSSQQDQKDNQQNRLSLNNSSTLPVTSTTASPLLQNQLSLPATETTTASIDSGLSMDNLLATSRPSELTPSFSFNAKTQGPPEPSEDAMSEFNAESDADTKRKRFCNTYNILSKSGLLDITLRTKELLRQNRRTQTDIERLKEQTDLFLQALSSGDNSICLKLQASLQEEEKERERERAALDEVKTE